MLQAAVGIGELGPDDADIRTAAPIPSSRRARRLQRRGVIVQQAEVTPKALSADRAVVERREIEWARVPQNPDPAADLAYCLDRLEIGAGIGLIAAVYRQ